MEEQSKTDLASIEKPANALAVKAFGFIFNLVLTFSFIAAAQNQELFLRLPLSASTTQNLNIGLSEIVTQDLTGYEIFQTKIIPPSSQSSLAMTFFFEEKELKTIRVLWILPSGESQVLCSNLSEGTLLQNQRTVLLPAASIPPEGGTLLIQSDQISLDLHAIHFQWSSPATFLSSVDSAGPNLLTPQGLLRAEELSGQPFPEKIDSAQSTVATTVLVSRPESIDNVAYGFDLPKIPSRARIELELQGLPVEERVHIYLNGIDLGFLPIETPSLNNNGYLTSDTHFWGWRKSTLWIPQSALVNGSNTIQLTTSSQRSISIKNLLLETDFKTEIQP